jgi:hypothetical protein
MAVKSEGQSMKIYWVVSLGISVAVTIALASASDKLAERRGADQRDLTGVYDGGAGGGADDWGEVKVKATKEGYIGTYSDTLNGQPGGITFQAVTGRKYKGLWWESSLKRYGSFELEASKDGQSLAVTWKALDGDNTKAKGGKSTWKKKAK